jgi:hypothetical protein
MPSETPNRADARATTLEEHVARIVAECPPLSDEQRERLAALLHTGR